MFSHPQLPNKDDILANEMPCVFGVTLYTFEPRSSMSNRQMEGQREKVSGEESETSEW